MTDDVDVEAVRTAVSRLPRDGNADHERPSPATFFVPKEHRQALDWDAPVVVGARGSGKTFWWQALQDESVRPLIEGASPKRIRCVAAFGIRPSATYPARDVIVDLLRQGSSPRAIWRAVIQVALGAHDWDAETPWRERVARAQQHPELLDRWLRVADDVEVHNRARVVLLFDALDRAAYEWPDLSQLLRGLLEVILDLTQRFAIRAKVFVRPDQFDDESVWTFRDAAKLRARRVDLDWSKVSLYAMLFHRLTHDPDHGEALRRAMPAAEFGLPMRTKDIEALQERQFGRIADAHMGHGPKRGRTYTWLPNHLADAFGRVSPRSFLVAIHEAGQRAHEFGDEIALPHQALKHGVQRAATIRVDEIKDDSPWVSVCGALSGSLPLAEQDAVQQWSALLARGGAAFDAINEQRATLPRHWSDGPRGWIVDLERLGVLTRVSGDRIDMPDVYRVGFRLTKRGGVPPIRAR